MKILFIQDSLGPGGAEKSNSYLWYYLREKGIELRIVLLKHWPGGLEEEILNSGFHIQFLKTKSFKDQVFEIAQIIKNEKPDLVHSVLFNANIRVRFAKLLVRFIHLESLVNLTYDKTRLNDPKVKKWKLIVLKWIDILTGKFGVDHFHANGKTVKKHYTEKLFVPVKKITVINRGRAMNPFLKDENNRITVRNQWDAGDKILFINVGRQEFQKGQDVLLDAVAMLSPEEKAKCLFIIAGREGNFSENLQKKLQALQLEDTVRFLGHRDDVPQLLAAADCFVFSSRFEGLPGALIEAEAAGLPIICSDIKNNLEVVSKNINALVFPPDQPSQLCEHIKILFLSAELRKQFSVASLQLFKRKFEINRIHDQMLKLYNSLLR